LWGLIAPHHNLGYTPLPPKLRPGSGPVDEMAYQRTTPVFLSLLTGQKEGFSYEDICKIPLSSGNSEGTDRDSFLSMARKRIPSMVPCSSRIDLKEK